MKGQASRIGDDAGERGLGYDDRVFFEELFSTPLRNGLTRPKSVRGKGVKMVNMGEIFAHDRIGNIPMDRVPLSDMEAKKYIIEPNWKGSTHRVQL